MRRAIEASSIGAVPWWYTAHMDYCLALDAVMPLLMRQELPLVRCEVPALAADVRQRLPRWAEAGPAEAALWVEPLAGSWQAELDSLTANLQTPGALYVVASRPLARLLPEREEWPGEPLGLRPGGLGRLRRAMRPYGFVVESDYGMHSLMAVGLNLLGGLADRCGRPDLADRLGFAARLRYCIAGPLARLSTVALLLAKKANL